MDRRCFLAGLVGGGVAAPLAAAQARPPNYQFDIVTYNNATQVRRPLELVKVKSIYEYDGNSGRVNSINYVVKGVRSPIRIGGGESQIFLMRIDAKKYSVDTSPKIYSLQVGVATRELPYLAPVPLGGCVPIIQAFECGTNQDVYSNTFLRIVPSPKLKQGEYMVISYFGDLKYCFGVD